MTLTKAQLIDSLQEEIGTPRNRTTELFEALLKIIKTTLADGEELLISGFGKFCVKDKKERKGRNPSTGEELILAKRRVITFRCSGKLRDLINKT